MSMALGHSSRHPLGVEAMPPLSAGLVVAWILRVLFGLRALMLVLLVWQGLVTQALLPQQSLGGEVNRRRWSHPDSRWCPIGALSVGPKPNWAWIGVGMAPQGALC
jgi:hypothetical protein